MVNTVAPVYADPGSVKLTTGTIMRVIELPLGLRVPAKYRVTIGAGGTSIPVTTDATGALPGATSINLTFTGTIPTNSFVTCGGVTLLTTAQATDTDAGVDVAVRSVPATVVGGTSGSYNPGAFTEGSTIIPVAPLPAIVDVRTVLRFSSNGQAPYDEVIVTGRSPAGARQLRVSPLSVALTQGDYAEDELLWVVSGATGLPVPSPSPKEVDTTRLTSGAGMEKIKSALEQQMSFELDLYDGDLGGELLASHGRDFDKLNREVFFRTTFPDGEIHEGVGLVLGAEESGELQDKRRLSISMSVQGETYNRTPATSTFY